MASPQKHSRHFVLLAQLGNSHPGDSDKRVAFFAIMGLILSDILNLVPLSHDGTAEIRSAIDSLVNDDRRDSLTAQ